MELRQLLALPALGAVFTRCCLLTAKSISATSLWKRHLGSQRTRPDTQRLKAYAFSA